MGPTMLGTDVLQAALQRKMQKDEAENDKVVRRNAEKTRKRTAYLKTCAKIMNLDQSL